MNWNLIGSLVDAVMRGYAAYQYSRAQRSNEPTPAKKKTKKRD